jgi:C1A family cysteine protease
MWFSPGVLDQGATSQCVAYSGLKWLTSHPLVNKPAFVPVWLYKEAQKVDEWPGEDYDGTSVRALFKVLKREGYVSEYRWAFDLETVVNHVLTTGPLVMGTAWDAELSNPDASNYIEPGARIENSQEGHAWLIIGANRKRLNPNSTERGAVRMINSWGAGWGDKGRAWMSFKSLAQLIEIDGEAAAAIEAKKV